MTRALAFLAGIVTGAIATVAAAPRREEAAYGFPEIPPGMRVVSTTRRVYHASGLGGQLCAGHDDPPPGAPCSYVQPLEYGPGPTVKGDPRSIFQRRADERRARLVAFGCDYPDCACPGGSCRAGQQPS